MNADDTGTLVWPAMTATEVRMEAADMAGDRHWDWPGACWCDERHQTREGSLRGTTVTLIAPPWNRSRWREPVAPAVTW
jgi:hypothetical protein